MRKSNKYYACETAGEKVNCFLNQNLSEEVVMEYNTNEPDKRNVKTDLRMSVVLVILGAIVYGITLTKGVFPGESAQLMATAGGFNPVEFPSHSLFYSITSWLGALPISTLPMRLNLFSLVCTLFAAVLLYRVVSFFIRDVITEEASYEIAPRVSTMAGGIAAIAFLFAVPVWQAATQFHYQNFNVLLPLLAAQMLVWFALHRWRVFLVLFAVICGVGICESPMFICALPLLIALALYVLWRALALSFQRIVWILALIAAVTWLSFFIVAGRFAATDLCAVMEMGGTSSIMRKMVRMHFMILSSGIPRSGWLLVLLTGVIPVVTSILAAFRGLNNERSLGQYFLHIVLSVLVIAALANTGMSPWHKLQPGGILPTGFYALIAMSTGYLFAHWYLLLKVRKGNRTFEVTRLTRQTGEWMGLLIAYPFACFVVLASVKNVSECGGSRGAFADRCAKEILNRMNGRTWLVTDSTLDAHLQIEAKQRGMELNLLCLQNDRNAYYLKTLWELLDRKQMFAEKDRQPMKTTLELGVWPFLQDWFAMDKEIETKAVVFGIPDLWYSADLQPIPDFFMFSGVRDIKTLADRPLKDEYMAFWQSMDKDLSLGKLSDKEIARNPTERARHNLRRHMGFVANNLGVLLEDLGNDKDAFSIYTYVSQKIDPKNISALFNRFEMAWKDNTIASSYRDQIEKEMKAFISDLKYQYPLWSLSRSYGYVRSPELFARLGYSWAMSGNRGAMEESIKRLQNLLPDEKRVDVLNITANMLAMAGNTAETERLYKNILAEDTNNPTAMLALARLGIQEGSIEKAKMWLDRVTQLDNRQGAFGVEWATFHLMNTNTIQARIVLQETTDMQPQNLQAWAMLSLLQIQQGELQEVESVILDRMEKIAGTADNYFILITRSQLALKKIEMIQRTFRDGQEPSPAAVKNMESLQRTAREAIVRAAELRPDVAGAKDLILQLDIAMNDHAAAERHARQILRANRHHALANYVLGAVRLQEGAYGEAEDHLRRSVRAEETPVALNDLAEALRRIKKLEEAEMFARKALEKAPRLYEAWDTLASTLADANKSLGEAEQMINTAIELLNSREPPINDPRLKITLARIQIKKGDIERAKGTLQQIRAQGGDALQKFDLEALKQLEDDIRSVTRK